METATTKLPDDIYQDVEQYRTERSISRSEALRRLVMLGLDHERVVSRVEDLEKRVNELETRDNDKSLIPWFKNWW